MMVNKKRCLSVLVLVLLVAIPLAAQPGPASQALAAIQRARAANDGDWSQLKAFGEALKEYDRIRRSNPGIGIPSHNMDEKLVQMRKQCAAAAVRAELIKTLPGGTSGTNIIIDIEANKIKAGFLETGSALLVLEREITVLRLDQLRTEREKITPGTDLHTQSLQDEARLDKLAQELSREIIKNEKAFMESSKTRMNLEKRLDTIRMREATSRSKNQ